MSSQIDATKPTNTHALTDDVRDNFAFAKSEIEALQNALAGLSDGPYLPLAGGQLFGELRLAADPIDDLDAASKRWVANNVQAYAPVHSVAGRGGDVLLSHSDIADWTTSVADFISKSTASPQTITSALTVNGNLTAATATLSGNSNLGSTTANGILLAVRGAANTVRRFDYFSGATMRWRVGVNNDNDPGLGTNAGSSYIFNPYDDNGVGLGSAITLIRADRQTQLQKLKIGGAQTLTFGGGPPNNNDGSLWLNYNYAGSSDGSGALNFNAINIVSDNVAVAAGQQAVGLGVQQNFGGPAATGGRSGLRWILTQTAPINYNATLQAGYFGTQANYPAGGTDVWANANGIIYGFAIDCSIGAGATNWRGGLGLQIGYGIVGSAQATGGLQISKGIDHVYQPPVPERNTIIRMSDAHSNGFMPGSDVGIMFGGAPGDWPIDNVKGKVISVGLHTYSFSTKPATAPFGIDLMPATFTNAAFRSQNMAILGDGSLQIGAAYLAASQTTGVSLDSKGSTVTGVAIVSGGANVYLNMPLWDDNTGTILYVTAVTGGVATAVSIYRAGWAVTPPANPVTFRAQPCAPTDPQPTNPTINLTWSAPAVRDITLNPSGGNVMLGGAGSIVLGTAGRSAAAPTTAQVPDTKFTLWKNTTDNTVKLYYNDGGTLKSVSLA